MDPREIRVGDRDSRADRAGLSGDRPKVAVGLPASCGDPPQGEDRPRVGGGRVFRALDGDREPIFLSIRGEAGEVRARFPRRADSELKDGPGRGNPVVTVNREPGFVPDRDDYAVRGAERGD
jgi:hypothetical protein